MSMKRVSDDDDGIRRPFRRVRHHIEDDDDDFGTTYYPRSADASSLSSSSSLVTTVNQSIRDTAAELDTIGNSIQSLGLSSPQSRVFPASRDIFRRSIRADERKGGDTAEELVLYDLLANSSIDLYALSSYVWWSSTESTPRENDIVILTPHGFFILDIKSHSFRSGQVPTQMAKGLAQMQKGSQHICDHFLEWINADKARVKAWHERPMKKCGGGLVFPGCDANELDATLLQNYYHRNVESDEVCRLIAFKSDCLCPRSFDLWFKALINSFTLQSLHPFNTNQMSLLKAFFTIFTKTVVTIKHLTDNDVNRLSIDLTAEQNLVVNGFPSDTRQMLIEGYAGTGKTLCAIARALHLANNNRAVIFISPQCAFRHEFSMHRNIKFIGPENSYERCQEIISTHNKIGFLHIFFDEVHSLMSKERWSCIRDIWNLIQYNKSHTLCIIQDDNQRHIGWTHCGSQSSVGKYRDWLYESGFLGVCYRLTKVIRNTHCIFEKVKKFYVSSLPIHPASVSGAAVKFIAFKNRTELWNEHKIQLSLPTMTHDANGHELTPRQVDKYRKDQLEKLRPNWENSGAVERYLIEVINECVSRLIEIDQFSAGDIAILCDHYLWSTLKDTKFKYESGGADAWRSNKLVFAPIMLFIGLERKVVILVHPEQAAYRLHEMYIGLSRAIGLLYVLAKKDDCELIDKASASDCVDYYGAHPPS